MSNGNANHYMGNKTKIYIYRMRKCEKGLVKCWIWKYLDSPGVFSDLWLLAFNLQFFSSDSKIMNF